jgi:cytoskeletal protein RodZ
MSFQVKNLEKPERICKLLRSLREDQNISLEEISIHLKMSQTHIQALEEGRSNELPFADVYKKKLVKQYCKIIGIDCKKMLEQFSQEEFQNEESFEELGISHSRPSHFFQNLPFLLRLGSILCIGLLFFGYLGVQVKKIIDPPALNLFSPLDGFVTTEPNLHLKGETEKEVTITVNGKEIKNSAEGAFDEVLTLSPGVNALVISAQKKHGKTSNETRYVVLQNKAEFSFTEINSKNN